jgi:tetratricopeptide (TPR) repeat protein
MSRAPAQPFILMAGRFILASGGVLFCLALTGCGSAKSWHHARRTEFQQPAAIRHDKAGEAQAARVASAHAHYGAGIIYDLDGEPAKALEEYYQALAIDPGFEKLVLEVADRLLRAKKPDQAIEWLKRSAARPEASGEIFARLAVIYAQQGKNEEAITASRTAIARAPNALSGYQNLFAIYVQRKDHGLALAILDQAFRQPKAPPEFLIGVADLYLTYSLQVPSGKELAKKRAVVLLNRAEKSKTSDPLKMELADAYYAAGETKKAEVLYSEILKTLPNYPPLRVRLRTKLVGLYFRDKDYVHAGEQLKELVRDEPTNPQAYYYLGSLALDQKKPGEAVEQFRKAILLDAKLEQAYYDLAIAQIDLDKPGDAVATLQKAEEKFRQNFIIEFLKGMAFSHQKAYPEALQHYTSAEIIAKATDPSRLNGNFYFQLGATYERKGDLKEAEEFLNKAVVLTPDFAEAMNYLGYMWADKGLKLEKARQLIEKALKLEPKNAAYLDSLGWVLYKQNRPAEALAPMLEAIRLSEQPDATLYEHIGDIYLALKNTAKARESWKKSLELEPNEAVSKKLKNLGP